jgi:hypothetical protein
VGFVVFAGALTIASAALTGTRYVVRCAGDVASVAGFDAVTNAVIFEPLTAFEAVTRYWSAARPVLALSRMQLFAGSDGRVAGFVTAFTHEYHATPTVTDVVPVHPDAAMLFAVRMEFSERVPVTVGAVVHVGSSCTTSVDAVYLIFVAAALVAASSARRYVPRSAAVTLYVLEFASLAVERVHTAGSIVALGVGTFAVQRNQRCVIGLVTPVQVAGVTERDLPTTGTGLAEAFIRVPPLIDGFPTAAGGFVTADVDADTRLKKLVPSLVRLTRTTRYFSRSAATGR